ncbi:MAG: glycosyltransferase [Desulfobacterales bacterium]|nr:glycosyltransferase [Desulfobacterales bacterium]MCP4163542.1 glycosyltransferase [Deltaproteobacteria bacterium]
MKILHLLSQRPEQTGSGVFVREIIKEAYKKGHDNCLLCGIPSHKGTDLKELNLSSVVFVKFESEKLPFPVPGMSDVMPYKNTVFGTMDEGKLSSYYKAFEEKITTAVESFKPDVILSHHLFIMTAIAKKLYPEIPLGVISHGTDIRQYKNCDMVRDFVKKYCSKVDAALALTKSHGDEIKDLFGMTENKIFICGSGINSNIFNYSQKENPSPVKILYAGKIARAKGVPWLLKSLSNVENDFELDLVGSGTEDEENVCFELAKQLENKVTIHGKVEQKVLSVLMKKAHIFVFPSFFEGLPLVLLEALASGTRVVTTSLKGTRELFKKPSKYVDVIDIPTLETIDSPFKKDEILLEKCLTNSISSQIKKAMKEKDVPISEIDPITSNYTWEKVFKRIEIALGNL